MDWINLAQVEENSWGCCEHGNELLDLMKFGEFLDFLRNYQLLYKDYLLQLFGRRRDSNVTVNVKNMLCKILDWIEMVYG